MDWSDLAQTLDSLLSYPLVSVGNLTLTLGELLGFLGVVLASWALAGGLKRLTSRTFKAESKEEEGVSDLLEPVVFWGVLTIGVFVGIDILGLDWAFVQGVLNTEIFTVSGNSITPSSIIVFAVIVGITWGVSRLLRRTTSRSLKHREVDPGTVATTQRLLHYAVMAVGLALALDNLGINLGALFAAGAVFAVGIGFAMQNIAQNFVSGLILLVERSIKPGDILSVEGAVVKVSKMGIRSTVARTRDEEEIIIPNSTLVSNSVKNYTLQDSLYRLRAQVGVAYESDLQQVHEVLRRTAEAVDWRVQIPEPVVLLTEFGNSSVNFDVSVWMNDPWKAPRQRSQLNDAIWWALADAGITIAFPQLDVHFDAPIEEAADRFPRAS